MRRPACAGTASRELVGLLAGVPRTLFVADADCARAAQLVQIGGAEAPFTQRFLRMLARFGGRTLNLTGGAAEARRRSRLHDALDLDEGAALLVVRMVGRFGHAEDGCEADVAALHDLAPFVTGFGFEKCRKFFLEVGPRLAIHLPRHLLAFESRPFEQFGVELGLNRTD